MGLHSIINSELINNINKYNIVALFKKYYFFGQKSLLFFPENYPFFEQSVLQIMR